MGRSRANNVFVSTFQGSWAGWTSIDVARGTEVRSFVEFKLRFCMCRRFLLVARDFGRCFVMRDSVRPGQDEKWSCLMARRKVYGRGLKAHPWRKAASSLFSLHTLWLRWQDDVEVFELAEVGEMI